jgi:hypothetical protein
MHTVEGARKDEIVVCRELVEAGVEVTLVDEAASFGDYEEGVDDPGRGRVSGMALAEAGNLHFKDWRLF